MIGSVRGSVIEWAPDGEVLIEVGGVGYRVAVPLGALGGLTPKTNAFLFTHLHVRDDAMVLYGFPTRGERETFEALIAASGVGPKLALAILSVLSPGALRRAMAEADLDALVAVPGVGKRTAQKLMIELATRLEVPDVDLTDGPGEGRGVRGEVRAALTELGYNTEEIRGALTDLGGDQSADQSAEVALKEALRRLATPT